MAFSRAGFSCSPRKAVAWMLPGPSLVSGAGTLEGLVGGHSVPQVAFQTTPDFFREAGSQGPSAPVLQA